MPMRAPAEPAWVGVQARARRTGLGRRLCRRGDKSFLVLFPQKRTTCFLHSTTFGTVKNAPIPIRRIRTIVGAGQKGAIPGSPPPSARAEPTSRAIRASAQRARASPPRATSRAARSAPRPASVFSQGVTPAAAVPHPPRTASRSTPGCCSARLAVKNAPDIAFLHPDTGQFGNPRRTVAGSTRRSDIGWPSGLSASRGP